MKKLLFALALVTGSAGVASARVDITCGDAQYMFDSEPCDYISTSCSGGSCTDTMLCYWGRNNYSSYTYSSSCEFN